MEQFVEILKSDKLHRSDNIPAMKHKYQRKYDGKKDKQTQMDEIPAVIDQLIVDPVRREAMAAVMAEHGRPAAARVIAEALREVGDG